MSLVTAIQPDPGVQCIPNLVTGMTIRGNKFPVSFDRAGWYSAAQTWPARWEKI